MDEQGRTEPPEMALLRGPLSQRATSAEFNEWQAREIVSYVDRLIAALASPSPQGREEIIEECAKIAAEFPNMGEYSGREIAARIRSLSHHTTGGGDAR